MKIVVTAKEPSLQAQVDPRFGRAACFILYDTDSGSHEVLQQEQDPGQMHGAGISSAEKVARSGAKAVITGNCGPNAYRALEAAGVKVYIGFSGTVMEAVNAFKDGKLNKAVGANVQGHWA